jgi:hypothetical protein
MPLSAEQQEWLLKAEEIPVEPNPCVRLFGKGPEGSICRDCTHLYRNYRQKAYIKCDFRAHTNGPGSDHKARWQACSRFEGKAISGSKQTTTTKG